MSDGAIFIITHDPRYAEMLLVSAASLKRAMPELPIAVFSQFPVESELFEKVIRIEPAGDGFSDKARWMRESPFERTLFLDADTYVLSPVPELFTLLDQFDCAATHEEYLNTDWSNHYPRTDIPSSFPEFNTGVLALKRSQAMDRVLDDWGALYETYLKESGDRKINDQPFFRVAVYRGKARMATLTREYNCKFRGQGYLNGPVKIAHGHVRLRLDPEFVGKAAAVLNQSTRPRVYVAGEVYEQKLVGRLVDRRKAGHVGTFPMLPEPGLVAEARRFGQIVKERGVKNTLVKVLAGSRAKG
jgi:hypothetical protein